MSIATLVILRDPAGILGRDVRRLHGDAPLQQQIEAAMPGGGAGCELLINGLRADPFTDPRLDAPPQAGDTIVVAHRPAGLDPVTIALIAGALLAVASYALIPKLPETPVANDSPNNRLTGQTNVARAYQAIPDVYGRRRVWPDLIQRTLVEYVDNVRTLTEWLCISRGVGEVTDVRFSDTPVASIRGASFEVFEPLTAGPVPPGVPADYAEAKWASLADVFEPFPCASVDGQEIGLDVSSDVVEQGCTLSSNGTNVFTLTFADGPQFDSIKALVPAGTTEVNFSYVVDTSPLILGIINEPCTVLSFTASGGSVTFTLQGTQVISEVVSGQTTSARLSLATTSNFSDWFFLPVESDRIWWNMVFLRGLQGTVNIAVEWEAVDVTDTAIAGSSGGATYPYTASSNDQQFFTTKVTPAFGRARYRVRFRRVTADLGNGADTAKLEALFAVRYYATRLLPGVTVIRLTTRATEQATSARELKFNLLWQRRVRALDSDTVSASRNFARAMAHLWTISGQPIAELDTAALAAVNASLGETDPLLRFDASLDDADVSLFERMQLIANNARCVFWRDGAKWTVTRDQARESPELQLDYRNLSASGQSVVNESFYLPASNDGVEVEFVDEVSGTKKAYYRLNISSGAPVAGVSSNPLRVRLPGCTTEAQAINRAQLEARKLLYQRTSVTDTALGDAQQLGPGSLVRWVDPNDFAGDDGLQAGEVLGIAGLLLTLSEPLDFKGEAGGRIQFTGSDGLLLGPPVICTPVAGKPKQVTLASAPAGLYLADGETAQLGSRYAFGVGLTAAEMESAGLYTVTEPRPNGDGTWSLAMVNYDARVYAFDSSGRTVIGGGVGAAVASGQRATITAGFVIVEAGVGVATASGRPATIGVAVPTSIAAGVGTAAASGRPASIIESGPINGASFSDGAVNGLGGVAIAGLRFRVGGAVAQAQTAAASSYVDYASWHRGAIARPWWVRFTLLSSAGGTVGGVGGGWLPMTADRTVTLTAAALEEASALVRVEFAVDAAGTDIRATQSASLSALSVS